MPDLNLDDLLAPIAEDNPAGDAVPFDTRGDLERFRKEVTEDTAGPDDPARPPDWPRVARIATQTLTTTSKDLQVAARLTEALTRTDGFPGLAQGMALLRRMIEECWDRLHPSVEDGDLEVRAGPFNWLADGDRGAWFPNTVRGVALVDGPDGGYGWRHWRQAQDGKGVTREEFDRAVGKATREHCQAMFDALDRTLKDFTALGKVLGEKIGPAAPAMTDLRAALTDTHTLAKQLLQLKGPAPSAEVAEEGEEQAATGTGGDARGSAARAVATRAEVYRKLGEAADLLQQLEPHSPIPYLVRKAVELGGLPFPQLMKALIDDDDALKKLNREVGVKGEPPADDD